MLKANQLAEVVVLFFRESLEMSEDPLLTGFACTFGDVEQG